MLDRSDEIWVVNPGLSMAVSVVWLVDATWLCKVGMKLSLDYVFGDGTKVIASTP